MHPPLVHPHDDETTRRRSVRIETARLVLREFAPEDFPAVHALFSCPQVMRFSVSGPLTPTQSRERLDDFLRAYAEHGFGKWAIVLRATGEVIGGCGPALTVIDDEGGLPARELGYRLRTEHWGRGLATEAAGAALDHCFKRLRFPHVLGFVEPANVASVRVLTKIGMRPQRNAVWHGRPVDVFVAYAPDTCFPEGGAFIPGRTRSVGSDAPGRDAASEIGRPDGAGPSRTSSAAVSQPLRPR